MSALLEELAHAPEGELARGIAPGDVVGGRFEILRELGRGGFGVVFEARDRELSRLVAVKTVRPRRGIDPAILRAEAEAAAQLHHPNIVTVHDIGGAGSEGWLVLELLRGETLEDRLRRGPLPREEALRVGTEVARGLAHAHRAGVFHRDLKPSNVFVCEDGAVKILDFGLSRVFGSGSGKEGGTPAYMAPEQWRREKDDERADVFALGVMLHEMLGGRRPYPVEGGRSAALDDGPVPELPAGAAPRPVRDLVRASLSRQPADRPRDGAAVLEALLAQRTAAQGGRVRRARWLAVGGALAAVAVVLLGLAAWRSAREREMPAGARIPVAVADFQNATSDPELNGLSGMLTTSLEQSRRLLVLTRSRLADLLRQAGKEVPERIDETLAREVGKAAGVKALLLATVHRFDDVYAIEMRALDPATDQYLFTLKEEGKGKSSVPGMIDRLSAQTRERLREQPAAVASSRGVAAVTTANLAAYEHYFKARQALDLFRPEVAQRELAAALTLDPDFALAHYQRAVVDAWSPAWLKFSKSGDEASGRTLQAHIDAAMRLADRLPEKERLGLLAWKATLDRRPDEAQRLRDQAAEAFPQDKDAVFWAGDVRFHRSEYEQALPYFERALKLDPAFVLALDHEARAHEQLGQAQAQLDAARRWAALDPGAEPLRFQGRALLGLGRREEAERVFAELRAKEGGGPVPALGYWLIAQGRPHDAEALAREGLRGLAERPPPPAPDGVHEERGPPGVLSYRWLLAIALGAQGRMREAQGVMDGMVAAGVTPEEAARVRLGFGNGARSPAQVRAAIEEQERLGMLKGARALHGAATSLAYMGDGDAAAAMEARAQAAPDWPDVPGPDRELYEALRTWRSGRSQEAEAVLRRLAESPQVSPRYLGLRLLGEVLLAQGKGVEGAEVLERSRALPWTMATDMRPWLDQGALLSLAEAYERLGDPARARARVDELLRAWQRADADLPRLAEAKALRRRLPAQATQR